MDDSLQIAADGIRWRMGISVATMMLCLTPSVHGQCACEYYSTCRAYRESTVILTGTVSALRPGEVRVVVRDVLRGTAPDAVDVPVDGECAANLDVARAYLVYGDRYDGSRLVVSGCSRTRPLAEATADLNVITSLNAARPEGSVYGEIIIPSDERSEAYTINLRGRSRKYHQTSRGGPYEFNGVMPGMYQLTINRGNDFSLRLSVRVEAQACQDVGYIRIP